MTIGVARRTRRPPIRWLVVCAPLLVGCTFGGETPPGCRIDHPEDCDPGWACRAGACFAYTTGTSVRDGGTDAADAATGDVDTVEDATADVPAE